MEQRFAVFFEGAKPKIYKLPLNKTARLINEIPGWKVEIFESLNDAREAVLTLLKRAKENAKPSISAFSTRPNSEDEELLMTLSELTEDRVERYYF
jgi:hypothetical protein